MKTENLLLRWRVVFTAIVAIICALIGVMGLCTVSSYAAEGGGENPEISNGGGYSIGASSALTAAPDADVKSDEAAEKTSYKASNNTSKKSSSSRKSSSKKASGTKKAAGRVHNNTDGQYADAV